MAETVNFPFERNKFYSVSELREFLGAITETRRKDRDLDVSLQMRKLSWAKVFSEELLPIGLLAQQSHIPANAQFRLMPEGNPVDVEIRSGDGSVTRFQITLAYPDWDGGTGKSRNPGYIAHLEREGIKQRSAVFLGGVIAKSSSGEIQSQPRARSNQVDQTAFEAGLRMALQRKLVNAARYKGVIDTLLVYASRLRFHLDYTDTSSIVMPIITAELEGVGGSPFEKIVVIDDDPLAYVEFCEVDRKS
jgi:hypothetical protein